MDIGIMGAGQVAQIIGSKLLEKGNRVRISSRNIDAEKDKGPFGKFPSARQWRDEQAGKGRQAFAGGFREAAEFGELVFNCTAGQGSLEALAAAGEENLAGKILIDLANPLDFSKGMPPFLSICNTESLGERIQQAFPRTKVVKTLNTVNALIMANPSLVPGDHDLFISGNDAESKAMVTEMVLKKWFHWKSVVDLGDISAARAMEMYLPLWLRLMGALKTANFNIRVVKGN